jgi:hypothetical protein
MKNKDIFIYCQRLKGDAVVRLEYNKDEKGVKNQNYIKFNNINN